MNIYKKLLKIQQQGIVLDKDGRNPHFNSEYATLNEVLRKIKKPLNDEGILILQTPEKDGLRTVLVDTTVETVSGGIGSITGMYATESLQRVECFMPYVETTTAQKLGSNNTYNRRYSLITLLGLEDEDDDAEVASKPVKTSVKAITMSSGGAGTVENSKASTADGGFPVKFAPITERNDEPFVNKTQVGGVDFSGDGLSDIKWD